MSIQTPEVTVHPPSQDDLDRTSMLPRDDTMGRRAVLLTDFSLAHSIERESADFNADLRKAEDPNSSIYSHPSKYHTPQERDAISEWEDLVYASSPESHFYPWSDAVEEELLRTRIQIKMIDAETFGADFDIMFNKIAPPMLVDEVTSWLNKNPPPNDDPNGTWLRWLSREPETPEDKQQLLNFLQWHNHRIETLQRDPNFQAAVTEQIGEYKVAIKQAEEEGWLANHTYDRVQVLLDPDVVQHFVGDEFYAALLGGAGAYAYPSENKTAYRPNDGKAVTGEVERSAKHEFNHLMGSLRARWLNEAVTEHIARCLSGRQVEDIYSDGNDGVYHDERNLLAAVINVAGAMQLDRGDKDLIAVTDFTRVYSTDPATRASELIKLFDRIEDIFGFKIMPAINAFIIREEHELQESGVTNQRLRESRAAHKAAAMVYQQPEKLKEYLEDDLVAA